MIKTRIGKLVKVKNRNKKITANDYYHAVILKDCDEYTSYLFTDVEILVARERARKNIEDNLERSVISKLLD